MYATETASGGMIYIYIYIYISRFVKNIYITFCEDWYTFSRNIKAVSQKSKGP
jgi:hypothetical protein